MTDHFDPPESRGSVWPSIRRGLQLKCPNCGEGPILAGYLKPASSCTHCGEDFTDLRADDGPAWATILIVGHLVSPSFLLFATPNETLRWMGFALILTIMLTMVFFLQPRMKGLFMSVIWHNRSHEPAQALPPGDV